MQAARKHVINVINQLPDDADMEEITYRLCIPDKDRHA